MIASTRTIPVLLVLALVSACATSSTQPPIPVTGSFVPATSTARPLAVAVPCENRFMPYALPFTTEIAGPPYEVLDGNGSGMALGDLDGDGRTDIVLGNLDGPNAIFWNLGNWHFRRQTFGEGGLRSVTIVDVDGDSLLDIVGAHRYAKPILWHNTGNADRQQRFVQTSLPDVNNPAYALDWADFDGDGNLDLVAGSYDTELLKHEGMIFTQRGNGVGVFVYMRRGNTYISQRLAEQADALAIALPDVNGDGRPDIMIGNDFNRPDYVFVQKGDGWEKSMPFSRITENTMSLALGDIDNSGSSAIFAADMKPYHKDTLTMAEWLPMMKRLTKPLSADDPQNAENALQIQGADGRWHDVAYERMIDSSGWSWSSKFGDLDNDGFLDLYVVNGMLARGLFDHLPNQELVEQNLAFHNDTHGGFQPAPQWGLGLTASGRSMSMVDLNEDGRLDIVINNVGSPAMVLENRLCGGQAIEVDLNWNGTNNRSAIGAHLALQTSVGMLTRDVTASSGYLSGDSTRVHFGVPDSATIGQLSVRWPDGSISMVDPPQIQTLVTVTR
ncbi:MAG: CRTAC1 family protein [Roseiflexaceae bacterium]|nr:CRTAC1 family protein [Roseiflexaceae bacterium]